MENLRPNPIPVTYELAPRLIELADTLEAKLRQLAAEREASEVDQQK